MSTNDLAATLRDAESNRAPIVPFADNHRAGGIESAYAIQNANTEHALKQGRRLVGRKIGLTSFAVQKQLGVNQPDYGMLFADMEIAGSVPVATLIAPKVEAEIAFILSKDLSSPDTVLADVIAAIDWALPALEIVDSRIADWKIGIFDTIADNASSGRYVLGDAARRLHEIDLRLCGAVLEQNGDPLSFGAGAACLGHPLQAVRWLASTMARAGRPLQAGDLVLSGALGPMLVAKPGDRFEAQINGLGRVAVAFDKDSSGDRA